MEPVLRVEVVVGEVATDGWAAPLPLGREDSVYVRVAIQPFRTYPDSPAVRWPVRSAEQK